MTTTESSLHTTPSPRSLCRATNLTKSYGTHQVLRGITFDLHPGHRLGVVGENGAGKSTLLRIIAGVEAPDTGTVERPEGTALGYLSQALPGMRNPEVTVGKILHRAIEPALAVRRDLEAAAANGAGQGYAELLAFAELTDAWGAERRAEETLAALGLATIARERTACSLSGGEQARLELAALLVRQPPLLVLDEPTNHLDDDALTFLEATLRSIRSVVIVASHDRLFLDEVCTAILDLDPVLGGYALHRGRYSDFLRDIQAERSAWRARYEAEQGELAELRLSVHTTAPKVAPAREMKDRNKMAYGRHGDRVEAQVSRRVRNAQRRLDELTRTQVPRPPEPLSFRGFDQSMPSLTGELMRADRVTVLDRLAPVDITLAAGDAVIVTGPNGIGKSTLLFVLAGRLAPTAGRLTRAQGASVSLLEQDVAFPDPFLTPHQIFAALAELRGDRKTPTVSELGLLPPSACERPVASLSEGQRRRVALALLVAQPPNVLLLDEPTNHLSLTLADELHDAFKTAPGAVVVASHDRWLRRRWHGTELRLHPVGGDPYQTTPSVPRS